MTEKKNTSKEARKTANEKDRNESVEEIRIRIPKEKEDMVRTHVAARSESMNDFIIRAIDNQLLQDDAD